MICTCMKTATAWRFSMEGIFFHRIAITDVTGR